MIAFFEKWIRHISNPLHVYCRLMCPGMKAMIKDMGHPV
jgi:hypothetical protein